MSIVSNNIKYLRRLNGLTQEQFSRRIGIKRSLLGAYEEARANPNLDNLKVIANTFGVSVDNLIKQDIRRLRDTPDLTFNFTPKSTDAIPDTEEDDEPTFRRENSQPKPISELLNSATNFAPIVPAFARPIATGIKLISQRVTFKAINKVANYQPNTFNSGSFQPLAFNNSYENKISQKPDNHIDSTQQVIQLVRKNQFLDYLAHFQNINFLKSLTEFQIPFLPSGEYRAFEANEDFIFSNSLLIGSFIRNWFEILDAKNYVLVTKSQGIIYRKVYNQVKNKGILLVTSDNPPLISSQEIAIKDILEAWEIRAFISQELPQAKISLDKIGSIVDELQFELERIKK